MERQPASFRVEVRQQAGQTPPAAAQRLLHAIQSLGITGITACMPVRLFFVRGATDEAEHTPEAALSEAAVNRLATALLADPVIDTATVQPVAADPPQTTDNSPPMRIETTLLPGVTDPEADNLLRAAHLLGVSQVAQVATGHAYELAGSATPHELEHLATRLFANPVIQRYSINAAIAPPFVPPQASNTTVERVPLRNASDDDLINLSHQRRLALDLTEMQAIRDYFRQQQRDPTDAELETLAQTWSEHCVHKTFKALIKFHMLDRPEVDLETVEVTDLVDGLLRSYIQQATHQVNRPWVRSAFVDNAGVIAFNEQWDLAFKVETHNRPSALDPCGGAHTGVGGVVRDILGVSARPIANTDVLCFGPPDLPESDLPPGVLHPQRIAAGVTHGIEDYGNKMGIPTVNGAIHYHRGYTANPLVFCGCLGIAPRDSHPTSAQSDDLIVVLGGRTGRDGLRGATFSSMGLDEESSAVAGSAVQIGNPIQEKQVLEVVLRARDERLYHAITDCGAGGLASAVGEMGRATGVQVQLETVPLKYPGLRPWEIWLSEAQERMVLAVPPDTWPRLREICAGQNVEAVAIGRFTSSQRLQIFYAEQQVAELDMDFLHDGLPRHELLAVHLRHDAHEPPPVLPVARPELLVSRNLTASLLRLLAHPNIASKEPIIRRYDHEVQGGTVIKPLVGQANHGPADAAVLVPLDTQPPDSPDPDAPNQPIQPIQGVALAVGLCPHYGELDPYAMAWAAIDEAFRNAVCVGADPDRIALLDNFCWGTPSLPDRLGSLVRCAQGCHDAAVSFQAPFISGKDSLNNEYMGLDGTRRAIPGTLLISALGIVPDVRRTVTMDFKRADNLIFLVGDTRVELGGSHYRLVQADTPDEASLRRENERRNVHYRRPPQPVGATLERCRALHRAIQAGLVQACHDCSEGGIGVAVAEMCIAGRIGAELNMLKVSAIPFQDDELLFSESLGRFLVEVRLEDADAFQEIFAAIPHGRIGFVRAADDQHSPPRLVVRGQHQRSIIDVGVDELEKTWRGDLAPPASPPSPPSAPAATPPAAPVQTGKARPGVLLLHANGTNRDREAALACARAGGHPTIAHVNQVLTGEIQLLDYQMLVLPGGFSYGDDLGAGQLWALDLQQRLGDGLHTFAATGRPVLGICNGFQALVKAGVLPGSLPDSPNAPRTVTLTYNESGHFECRWVYLRPNPTSPCLFTQGFSADDLIYCPVAHGEGRFVAADAGTLAALASNNLIALHYSAAAPLPNPATDPADGQATAQTAGYPANPNGSQGDIAGICNPAGNVLGLMPHPEDHIAGWQHPRAHRGEGGMLGLRLFENGIRSIA